METLKFKQIGKNLNLSLPNEKTLTLVLDLKTERDVIKEQTAELINKYNTTKSEKSKTKILKDLKVLYSKTEQIVETKVEKLKEIESKKEVVESKSFTEKVIDKAKTAIQSTINKPVTSRSYRGEY
jgi:hypothetical protein